MAYLNQERKKVKTKLDVDEISRAEFINVVVAWDTKGESLQKKRKKSRSPLTEREPDLSLTRLKASLFLPRWGASQQSVLDVGRHRAFGNTTETAHLTFHLV